MKKTTFWNNKRVLVTGHTGFKGAWLSLWLAELGAEVHGLALDPPTQPNFFTVANLAAILASDSRLDIRNNEAIQEYLQALKPEVVFHLAAQPLVQYSYDNPVETYSVNVMGTVHLLEAVRYSSSVEVVVVVTTDKCYENHEWIYPYRENDRLGGLDPYSNSKACAELVVAAYRASYFSKQNQIRIATARAGNVIGGGDWALNRLIPDCVRAHVTKTAMALRFPEAVRPWQHVLESIKGYLMLAEQLFNTRGSQFSESWNFGPEIEDMRSVGEVAGIACRLLEVPLKLETILQERHEARVLRLDSTKAKEILQWCPRWHLQEAIQETVEWYRHCLSGEDMLCFSRAQIERYNDHSE